VSVGLDHPQRVVLAVAHLHRKNNTDTDTASAHTRARDIFPRLS
jgi:hypothetical protein